MYDEVPAAARKPILPVPLVVGSNTFNSFCVLGRMVCALADVNKIRLASPVQRAGKLIPTNSLEYLILIWWLSVIRH